MAIAHICLSCGRDLARVRPTREPHYGLNMIVCPGCGGRSVRRRRAPEADGRSFRRASRALAMLLARLLVTLLLTLLNMLVVFMCLALWSEIRHHRSMPIGAGLFLGLAFGVLAPLTGVWLRAALEHIAWWKLWLLWIGWLTLILLVISLHGPLDDDLDPRGELGIDGLPAWRWTWEGLRWIVLPGMAAAGAIMLAALPGILAGRGLLWLAAAVRRARWRARYRRAHVIHNVSWE
jgi:hypothetical protein